MIRKSIPRIILCLVLAVVMLGGCGSPTSGTASSPSPSAVSAASDAVSSSPAPEASTEAAPAEPVTITFWHGYGDVEEPVFNEKVLTAFETKYPNIKVEAMRQTDMNQVITAAFGTGQTPDVARIDIMNIAAYANEVNGLLALDDMQGFAELKAQCLEAPVATNLFKGKYYGLPLDTNCKAAVMNMNIMNKLGLTQPPATMEELIDASKAKSPGTFTINVSGVGDWDLFPWFWAFGGTVTDPTFTKATGYLDSPASIAALQELVDLHNQKVFTIRDIDGTADAWDMSNGGDYAMFLEGPWFFSSNPTYKDLNLTCAPVPTYNGKSSTVVGGEDVVIFKNSKHPKEAFEFVKFLLSNEAQSIMASVGQMPALKSALESDQIKNDPIMSVYAKQLANANSRIPSVQNSTIVQIWSDEVTKVFQGEETAEQALKTIAPLIDEQLAK